MPLSNRRLWPIALALLLVYAVIPQAMAQPLQSSIATADQLSHSWQEPTGGGSTSSNLDYMVLHPDGGGFPIPTRYDVVTMPGAAKAKLATQPGDADKLKAKSFDPAKFQMSYDWQPGAPAGYVSSNDLSLFARAYYKYVPDETKDEPDNAANLADFAQRRQWLIDFVASHRQRLYMGIGLPWFAWDATNQLASGTKIGSPLSPLDADPKTPNSAIAKGVVNQNNVSLGIGHGFLHVTEPGWMAQAGVTENASPSGYNFTGVSGGPYSFKGVQLFLFQKEPQEYPNFPSKERSKGGVASIDGWEIPALLDTSLTALDTVVPADMQTAIADLPNLIASGKYEVVYAGGATSLTDYKDLKIQDPNTYTVQYPPTPSAGWKDDDCTRSFDTKTEGTDPHNLNTPFSAHKRCWRHVLYYSDCKIYDGAGTLQANVGPYLFTHFIYDEAPLSYIPATRAQARMGKSPAPTAIAYQSPPSGSLDHVRPYIPPDLNVNNISSATLANLDLTKPIRTYRGIPEIGPQTPGVDPVQLVGADPVTGEITGAKVNQDSQLCMNLCTSLATRRRYNPDPNAAAPLTPMPSDPKLAEAWLDQYYPVCISYYPPYPNSDGKIVGPYVRRTGPINPGFPDASPFRDDPYGSGVLVPGQDYHWGALYPPINFVAKDPTTGAKNDNLLQVVNYLVLPPGHPFLPAVNRGDPNQAYGSTSSTSFLNSHGYALAWNLDFDPSLADAQEGSGASDQFDRNANGTPGGDFEPGEPVEVIRLPIQHTPVLKLTDQMLPIHPQIYTREEKTQTGSIYKAMFDSKLMNGPKEGSLEAKNKNTDTQKPGYARNNFIYAVVGNCCGPTVLLNQTMAQGPAEVTLAGKKQKIGPRPNCVLVMTPVQADKDGKVQEEALGIPNGLELAGPGLNVGTPAAAPSYDLASISSRADPLHYQWGAYQDLQETIGFDRDPLAPNNLDGQRIAAREDNSQNPADSKGNSFLEAQGEYITGQRYIMDVYADTPAPPQLVSVATANVVAYFTKEMKVEIFEPGKYSTPDQVYNTVKVTNLANPPADPPRGKYDFVPRHEGDYVVQVSITDFNDIRRITRMRIPVKPASTDVNKINSDRERK